MNNWQYDTMRGLDQGFVERLRRFPREPDMLVFGLRSLAALAIRIGLRTYNPLEVIGKERLPSEGPLVLVANHTSHLDTLCLLSALPLKKLHRVFPAAASDYFFTSLARIAVAAVAVNALPFQRNGHMRHSIRLCRELLADPRNVLIIFPEGTRSTTGQIGEFKPGVGALLAGTSVPVVPCYLEGTLEAWPKGRMLPRPGPLRLMIGTPRDYAHLDPGKSSARQICTELRRSVMELRTPSSIPDSCPGGSDHRRPDRLPFASCQVIAVARPPRQGRQSRRARSWLG